MFRPSLSGVRARNQHTPKRILNLSLPPPPSPSVQSAASPPDSPPDSPPPPDEDGYLASLEFDELVDGGAATPAGSVQPSPGRKTSNPSFELGPACGPKPTLRLCECPRRSAPITPGPPRPHVWPPARPDAGLVVPPSHHPSPRRPKMSCQSRGFHANQTFSRCFMCVITSCYTLSRAPCAARNYEVSNQRDPAELTRLSLVGPEARQPQLRHCFGLFVRIQLRATCTR